MKMKTKNELPFLAKIAIGVTFLTFLIVAVGLGVYFKQQTDIKNRIELIKQEKAAVVTIPSDYLEVAKQNVEGGEENTQITWIAEETVSAGTTLNLSFTDTLASGHVYYVGTDDNYSYAIGKSKTYMLCDYVVGYDDIWLPNIMYAIGYGKDGVTQNLSFKYRLNGEGDWMTAKEAETYTTKKGDVIEVLAYVAATYEDYTFEWLSPDNKQGVSIVMTAPAPTVTPSEVTKDAKE